MINNYFSRGIGDCQELYIDGSRLAFHAFYYLNNDDELGSFLNKIESFFIKPLEHDAILFHETAKCRGSYEKAKRDVIKEIRSKNRYIFLGYDGYIKGELLQNKKDVKQWKSNRFHTDWNALRIKLSHVNLEKNREIIKECVSKHKNKCDAYFDAFQMIQQESRISYEPPDTQDIMFHIVIHRCENCPFEWHAELKFDLSTYCLGEYLDACANHLKYCSISLAEEYKSSTAYIEVTPSSAVNIPVMGNYFNMPRVDFERESDERYLMGLAWFNIVSGKVIHLIKDELLRNDSNEIQIMHIHEDCIGIGSRNPIGQFSREEYSPQYDILKKCLRPGYSVKYVESVRKNGEMCLFYPDEYEVDEHLVKFRRGNITIEPRVIDMMKQDGK